MKFVLAIDSFKGCITSNEAGFAAAEGIKRCLPDAEIKILPIADGGEGTVDALVSALDGRIKEVAVKDPIGRVIIAKYGIIKDTAVIEMAEASGIALLKREELNPLVTTTYGVGELICDAISSGCRKFIIGIGGSATNDAGTGMLSALGFEFLDKDGKQVPFGAQALAMVSKIKDDNVIPALYECEFKIACDVKNPLIGELGCSAVFSPQKGATPDDVKEMEAAMCRFAEVCKEKYPKANPLLEGAGAAGGLGFAFTTFLGGKLQSGIEIVLDEARIEDHIKDADLVITGEGRVDSQTAMGKAPAGVAARAKKYGKPVVAFAGSTTRDANLCNAHGIDAIFPILRTPCTLSEAMEKENAMKNMADTVEQVVRLFALNR